MSLAIVEIAGRDSVAAAVAAVRERHLTRVLPTIAFTGTETGDTDAPARAVKRLAALLGDSCEVLEPRHLQDSALWSAMNARPAAMLSERFGVYSPCLACHLYLHLLRVRPSWEHGNAPVVSGERDTHDGRVKLSQTPAGIDAAIRVLDYAGIELLEPVRGLSGDAVAPLVGGSWEQGAGQLGCLLSGNYADYDGAVRYDEVGYARYLAEYLEPLGRAIVDGWRGQATDAAAPDYTAIVRGVIGA